MALFILCGSSSSFSTRFYILALIALVLVCFCSYCSSSPIISPVIGTDQLSNNIDESSHDDGISYEVPFRLSSHNYIPEQPIAPVDDYLIQLLLQSASKQHDYRPYKQNNKRYAPQAFHAMRG